MTTTRSANRRLDTAMWGLLLVVTSLPVLSSGTNLYHLGQDQLALTGRTALLVPLSVDAAALLCVFLTLRAVHAGRSAGAARLLILVFAGLSAWLGYQEAVSSGHGPAAKVFYPAMPFAAAFLLDLVIRALRADTHEAQGATEPALPRFRAVKWLVMPGETWRAWVTGLRYDITDPGVCKAVARQPAYARQAAASADEATIRAWLVGRGDRVLEAAPHALAIPEATEATRQATEASQESQEATEATRQATQASESRQPTRKTASEYVVKEKTKGEHVENALAATGGDVKAAVAWLTARGVSVSEQYAYKIAKAVAKETQATPGVVPFRKTGPAS